MISCATVRSVCVVPLAARRPSQIRAKAQSLNPTGCLHCPLGVIGCDRGRIRDPLAMRLRFGRDATAMSRLHPAGI